MIQDRFFYPLLILVIAVIVTVAMLPSCRDNLSEAEIISEGYLMEGDDLALIQASPGTTVDFVGETSAEPAYITAAAHLSRNSAPASAGVFAPLGSDYEQALAGRDLRMTLTARQGGTNPTSSFRMGYFTAGAGDSGWKAFDLTPEFQDYSFTFTPPVPTEAPDLDYFGVWPDEEGEQREMDISRFKIEVLK
ncbi:hypothetical protein [Litorimonas haliclonae]|uniref:hypothetical protein n=1 Tax=Litorimonas haliclonae TaxID=2081977 RepID=UPI0039EFF9A8